jgi:hypothetical protein
LNTAPEVRDPELLKKLDAVAGRILRFESSAFAVSQLDAA